MDIRIRVGAAVDGDIGAVVFAPLVAAAKRARAQVKAEMDGMAADVAASGGKMLGGAGRRNGGSRRAGAGAGAGGDGQPPSTEGGGGYRGAAPRERVETEKSAARERVKTERESNREIERDLARSNSEKAKLVRQYGVAMASAKRESEANDRKAEATFGRVAHGGLDTAKRVVSGAGAIAGDIARGAGVDFSVASGVKKRVDLEAAAVKITNSGHIEGAEGAAGKRADHRAVMADIQRTGSTYGIKQDTVAEGLDAFVGKTGDLQTGRDMLDSFAKTAKATGAEFNDVAAAAAAISNKIGDVGKGKEFETTADKAKAVNKVMMALAGQGKVGAVEIKDLATQMEKLTSQASKFAPNKDLLGMTGGSATGANIGMLGVLAQSARKTEKGSAAQATQSAMAFIADLNSSASVKRLGGMQYENNKAGTPGYRQQLRDPQEVIKDIIVKTGGDQSKLANLMSQKNSRAVVNSFMDPYLKASNSTKGTPAQKEAAGRAAVDAAFAELKQATLSDAAQNQALAAAMDTTATKAEIFQQKLDQVVGDMADKVIPKMLEMAPMAEEVAKHFASAVNFAADNPGKALAIALAGSVAKAGVEEVVKSGMTSLMGKAVSSFGTAGAIGLTVAALWVTANAVNFMKTQEESRDKVLNTTQTAFQEALDAANKADRTKAPEDIADAQAKMAKVEEINDRAHKAKDEGYGADGVAGAAKFLPAWIKGTVMGDETASKEYGAQSALGKGADNTDAMVVALQSRMDALNQALKGTLLVKVTNQPGPGAPSALPPGSSTR